MKEAEEPSTLLQPPRRGHDNPLRIYSASVACVLKPLPRNAEPQGGGCEDENIHFQNKRQREDLYIVILEEDASSWCLSTPAECVGVLMEPEIQKAEFHFPVLTLGMLHERLEVHRTLIFIGNRV